MHEFTLDHLRCVRCKNKLELEVLKQGQEISEGFLYCKKCSLTYPIISKIPILWDDFSAYLSRRTRLGGSLLKNANSSVMKKFVKLSLSRVKKNVDDITSIENKWVRVYQNSKNSQFYSKIKKLLNKIPSSDLVLEHGCSIGLVSEYLAQKHNLVFGIDSSFPSLLLAKKTKRKNLDYIISDSLCHPFGEKKFNVIVALNLLEIVEPSSLLKTISDQIQSGLVLLSSPYDYERGTNSVRHPINEKLLRPNLKSLGFKISLTTKKPSYIQWRLNLNERAVLDYKADVVLAKK